MEHCNGANVIGMSLKYSVAIFNTDMTSSDHQGVGENALGEKQGKAIIFESK